MHDTCNFYFVLPDLLLLRASNVPTLKFNCISLAVLNVTLGLLYHGRCHIVHIRYVVGIVDGCSRWRPGRRCSCSCSCIGCGRWLRLLQLAVNIARSFDTANGVFWRSWWLRFRYLQLDGLLWCGRWLLLSSVLAVKILSRIQNLYLSLSHHYL